MAPRAAWKVLGIAPTAEIGAIRRAYADRLRALDTDADPAAFDQLRAAREVAMAIARRQADAPASADPPRDNDDLVVPLPAFTFTVPVIGGSGDPTLSTTPLPAPFEQADSMPSAPPGKPVATLDAALPAAALTAVSFEATPPSGEVTGFAQDPSVTIDLAYERIVALLLPGGESSDWAPDPAEQAELDSAIDTVVADPRLEELGFRDRAEEWFAAVLSDSIPRSDTVIHRIVALFGWRERLGRIGESLLVERVVQRARTLTFVTAVQNPDHRFHKAWAELTDAVPERRLFPWRASRRTQRELLTQVRTNLPDLEAWLNPARVGNLEQQVSGPGIPFWALSLIALALLRICASALPTEAVDGNATVPVLAVGESEPLRTRDADLDLALLEVADGFTAARVRLENPTLFLALDHLWQDAQARGERIEPFRRQIAIYLDGQLRRAIRRASYDDIAAYRRLDRIMLAKLAQLDPQQCPTANATDPALTLGDAERLARRALHARMLLASEPGPTPSDRYTFRVPGDVMHAIGENTRLSRPAVSRALSNEGDPAAICQVRGTLIDAALKLPHKQGLRLLREI